ncbi:DUF3592 domain-containing protein [Qipengyuania nanhaisediminis]|uniref:DUF3592 domain-containing protein n=1 Tax=Qipengyuania nanhaisediminis TaxID=604088 RepID=UPI0038B33311
MTETAIAWTAAIIASVIGWGSLFHFAWIVRHWPHAQGRVIDNIAEWSHGDAGMARSAAYFPVIAFLAGNQPHQARGGVGKRKPWAIGTEVNLHYNPANPDHLLDLNAWQRAVFSGAFIAFGAAAFAAAMGWVT